MRTEPDPHRARSATLALLALVGPVSGASPSPPPWLPPLPFPPGAVARFVAHTTPLSYEDAAAACLAEGGILAAPFNEEYMIKALDSMKVAGVGEAW